MTNPIKLKILREAKGPTVWTMVIRYGTGLLLPLLAFIVNLFWHNYLAGSEAPFLLYFLAITLTAISGGLGPTIVATVLSSILMCFSVNGLIFVPPGKDLSLQMAVFAIEGVVLGFFAQSRLNAAEERAKLLSYEHKAREEAERSRDQRDEFIALASHEIRTPLTSIKGFNELLQKKLKKSRDPKVVEYLGYMKEQVDRLTILVVDFLDTTKIRTGKLEISKTEFSVRELIEKTVHGLEPSVEHHRIIIARCDEMTVKADQTRIGQVLSNLISNAVKYSLPTKKIIITAKEEAGELVVSIQDFGIGIDEGDQKHIFDQFFQSADPARPTRGLGLGLYISAAIIQKHHGEIWLTSKKGEGSTFFFKIPDARRK